MTYTILKRISKDYMSSSSGQFAVWFALLAFPLLLIAGAAIDYGKANSQTGNVKDALDIAVLSAVSDNSISKAEKTKLAKQVFKKSYNGELELDLKVSVFDFRVEMSAKGQVPTSIGAAVGARNIEIFEKSIAEMNRNNTICVLALASKGKGTLRFLGKSAFNSPTCAVQSNSTDPTSLIADTSESPVAKSFCSAGGSSGKFFPSARGECKPAIDPYENRPVRTEGTCIPDTEFFSTPINLEAMMEAGIDVPPPNGTKHIHPPGFVHLHTHRHCHGQNACHTHEHTWHRDHHDTLDNINRLKQLGVDDAEYKRLLSEYDPRLLTVRESSNYTGQDRVMSPGTYCGGLTVDGANVRFKPGNYIIKDGPLTFKNGATADAQDVSFILRGDEAVLTVETGSVVTVKAPSQGLMAGLAFYEDQKQFIGGLDSDLLPSGVNLLSSGGELNVIGTLYFPTHALEVLGDSVLGAKAPATSFIAHQVTFAGSTKAEVSVDHQKAGLPAMLPKTDDGARLVE